MSTNGRTPISISNIESSLEAMTRRLESSSSSGSKVRRGLSWNDRKFLNKEMGNILIRS